MDAARKGLSTISATEFLAQVETARTQPLLACAVYVLQPRDAHGALAAAQEPEIPKAYREFAEVFSEEEARKLPVHGAHDHAIEVGGGQPPWDQSTTYPQSSCKCCKNT